MCVCMNEWEWMRSRKAHEKKGQPAAAAAGTGRTKKHWKTSKTEWKWNIKSGKRNHVKVEKRSKKYCFVGRVCEFVFFPRLTVREWVKLSCLIYTMHVAACLSNFVVVLLLACSGPTIHFFYHFRNENDENKTIDLKMKSLYAFSKESPWIWIRLFEYLWVMNGIESKLRFIDFPSSFSCQFFFSIFFCFASFVPKFIAISSCERRVFCTSISKRRVIYLIRITLNCYCCLEGNMAGGTLAPPTQTFQPLNHFAIFHIPFKWIYISVGFSIFFVISTFCFSHFPPSLRIRFCYGTNQSFHFSISIHHIFGFGL